MNSFDIDGVIYMGEDVDGVYPGPNDIIITGRSYEESNETYRMLRKRGILNSVFFNSLPFNDKTRSSSGIHKGIILKRLISEGFIINIHFEDDIIQKKEIERIIPSVKVVLIDSYFVGKENVRHA